MREIDPSDPEFASWMEEVEAAPEPYAGDPTTSEGRLGGTHEA